MIKLTESIEMANSTTCLPARLAEREFYSHYDWCLNPAQSLRDLLRRVEDELGRYRTLASGWQRDECRINLHLFICAIACTVDDYLAHRIAARLNPIARHFPPFRAFVRCAQWFLDRVQGLQRTCTDAPVRAWRERWKCCVDQANELLLASGKQEERLLEELSRRTQELVRAPLVERLLNQRMRVPEAYRCQDFTHHDVISLARLFVDSSPDPSQPYLVLGLRTAGSYFAPLIAAYLRLLEFPAVSWMSIRPKNGISGWEAARLRKLLGRNTRILVVDDYPNTGSTIRMTLQLLRRFTVPSNRVTILAPRHPAQLHGAFPAETKTISLFTLEPEQLHKARLLSAECIAPLLQQYYVSQGWQQACIVDTDEVNEINTRLWRHYPNGFWVRLKRVFAVRLSSPGRTSTIRKVFVKSAGWGWLSYHSFISGTRLSRFVPPVLGLRNGLLATEWMDGQAIGSETNPKQVLDLIPSYIATRVRQLPLSGNLWLESSSYRATGWDELLGILRGAYGPYISLLKIPALRKRLRNYVTTVPTLGDGKMGPEEWIQTNSRPRKADFEHHNFGGGELDVTDPAYDLASVVFEFGLSAQSEQQLLHAYARESGDAGIFERIILYKLLYASAVKRRAMYFLRTQPPSTKAAGENARYLKARKFLAFELARFSAAFMPKSDRPGWSEALFFLDVDGVFDRELFGFPHTSRKGLQSLASLQSNGYSVVLNTGRSVEHVRAYCQTYGLAGGLAEFGSVFVDAVRNTETPLVSAEATRQLELCREEIQRLPGVFTDPGYQYSIRAYRHNGCGTTGLSASELMNLFSSSRFSQLDFVAKGVDTYIIQKTNGKGRGLLAAKDLLHKSEALTAAIGDSPEDIEMLQAADRAYAPANCSVEVRQLAARGGCHLTRRRYQSGLLDAVLDLIPDRRAIHLNWPDPVGKVDRPDDLLRRLLEVSDRPFPARIISAFNWWRI